jgi:hypothetical protein
VTFDQHSASDFNGAPEMPGTARVQVWNRGLDGNSESAGRVMSDQKESRLTQSFVGLDDKSFQAVPALEKALIDTINKHNDAHHDSMGTVVTALACVIGEMIVMAGDEADQSKKWFLRILDGYLSAGRDGARIGPDHERSLVRKPLP